MVNQEPHGPVDAYVGEVIAQYRSGQAQEHGYRPALQRLMAAFPDTIAVNDPKRSDFGNPDFIFLRSTNKYLVQGYAETKDINVDLGRAEKSEQLTRYAGYDNLFLTNYLEFRFFKNGVRYQELTIGSVLNGVIETLPDQFAALHAELGAFLERPPEPITNGKRLAEIMGAKALRVRNNVLRYLGQDDDRNAELERMFNMIRKLLMHDLTARQFANMYAQTLVYGLFVARYSDRSSNAFTRQAARELVPASNPFLSEFFDHIVGPHFDTRLGYIVDELCEVFSVSDVTEIVHRHLKILEGSPGDRDPIINFYEDFLKAYDPQERKQMGAYYTPVPIVGFIIRAVDEILKRDFGVAKGIAATEKKTVSVQRQGIKSKIELHRVQILDPALGTATFLNEIVRFIYGGFKGQEGRWPSYVQRDLLPRIYGFELNMAPYVVAHLKLGMTLQETGIRELRQRLGIYLTNTLEEGVPSQPDLFGLADVVSHEASEAARIKSERPIMVVIGNPPYRGESSNKTAYATSLVAKYKWEPGGVNRLQERNPKWLNDDYVKFLAFAEDMIERNGEGVVGMITNHGYLDNPTFRGMRWHLAKTFDVIYVVDLHGNTKKHEVAPDGSVDQNVFDIQQGVAIIIGARMGKAKTKQFATVYHAELFGTRHAKFSALSAEPTWRPLDLDRQTFLFSYRNTAGSHEYRSGIRVERLFGLWSVGVVTGADATLIGDSRADVLRSVELAKRSPSKGRIAERLVAHDIDPENILPIAYRPFDGKYVYYAAGVLERPRQKVMSHYLRGPNIGLLFSRMTKGKPFAHAFVTDRMSEVIFLSPLTGTNAFNAPLYLYREDGSRSANLIPAEYNALTRNVKGQIEPEDVLDYVYGVLWCPRYRSKYEEFLKADYPVISVPKDSDQFRMLAKLGARLRGLHLLRAPELDDVETTYAIAGTDRVERVAYSGTKVWINDKQYFGGVSRAAFGLEVGGYQPALKWLKDRLGRQLSNADLEHYQKLVAAQAATISVMHDIDDVGLLAE